MLPLVQGNLLVMITTWKGLQVSVGKREAKEAIVMIFASFSILGVQCEHHVVRRIE
jgi:hypothetical protein